MSSQEESPLSVGEILSEPINARFDSDSLWADAWLMADPDELSRRVAMASVNGRDLAQLISAVDARVVGEDEVGGVVALTRWLLTRLVFGSRVRTPLYHLVLKECRDLVGQTVEETDRGIARLAERLRELPVSDNDGGRRTLLGNLLPPDYVVRSHSAEQTLKLASPPPIELDRMDPVREILLTSPGPSAAGPTLLKGCTPCRPDPNSSRGGSRFCIRPGFEGLVECVWPPPEPDPVPEPTWEYFVQVGNKWWTTLFGVWHGSAYTRTIKRTASGSVTVPWTVPFLSVFVSAASLLPWEDDYCGNVIGDWGDYDDDENDSDVDVSLTEPAIFGGPWGVYSSHSAGGLSAYYCEGRWRWT